jgi:hypothetical protein
VWMRGSFRTSCCVGLQKRRLLLYEHESVQLVEVGQVTLQYVAEGVVMLHQVEIHERYRGRGLATAMLSDLEELLQNTAEYATVRELRLVALEDVMIGRGKLEALYRSCGFQTQGTCTSSYADCSWYVPPRMSTYMTRHVPMSKLLRPTRETPLPSQISGLAVAGGVAGGPRAAAAEQHKSESLDLPAPVRNLCCRRDLNFPTLQEVLQALDSSIPRNDICAAVLSLRRTMGSRTGRTEPAISCDIPV